MYQREKAKRQDTLLPRWEEKAVKGQDRAKGQGQAPAQPQIGLRDRREGCRVRTWVEHEKENILVGL